MKKKCIRNVMISREWDDAVFASGLGVFVWMSHGTSEWVMAHMNESLSHMNESCLIWISHVTYEVCLVHTWHDSFIFDMTYSWETWLIHMRHDSFIWDMTHSYETWLIHMRHDSSIWDITHLYETWLIHMWHDSFICDMTHLYVAYQDKCLCGITHSWIHQCDIPHLYI